MCIRFTACFSYSYAVTARRQGDLVLGGVPLNNVLIQNDLSFKCNGFYHVTSNACVAVAVSRVLCSIGCVVTVICTWQAMADVLGGDSFWAGFTPSGRGSGGDKGAKELSESLEAL